MGWWAHKISLEKSSYQLRLNDSKGGDKLTLAVMEAPLPGNCVSSLHEITVKGHFPWRERYGTHQIDEQDLVDLHDGYRRPAN